MESIGSMIVESASSINRSSQLQLPPIRRNMFHRSTSQNVTNTSSSGRNFNFSSVTTPLFPPAPPIAAVPNMVVNVPPDDGTMTGSTSRDVDWPMGSATDFVDNKALINN
ncbi:unnamed protein product [Rotaria sp. Silwood2]|nr:unnamed protein product [Rotaria sp. Silwood2]CAF3950944.1 unnamed protein product [Rotaria sp. Silwood2]